MTIGIPTVATPSIGALTAASNTVGATSVIIVEVVGYGGAGGAEPAAPQDDQRRKDPGQQGYNGGQDPDSRIQVLGAGDMAMDETRRLADEKRKPAEGLAR